MLHSCSILVNRDESQIALNKNNECHVMDSFLLIKFNNQVLKNILDTSKAKYFLILETSTFCRGVEKKFNHLNSLSNLSNQDSIYLIPLIHDYMYSIRNLVENKANYNRNRQMFYTDPKIYKKGFQPIRSYSKNFVGTYVDSVHSEKYRDKNLRFRYKVKTIVIEKSFVKDSSSLEDILNNSMDIHYQLDL